MTDNVMQPDAAAEEDLDDGVGVVEPLIAEPWLPVLKNPAISYPAATVGLALAIFVWHQHSSNGHPIMGVTFALSAVLVVTLAVIDAVVTRLPDPLVASLLGVNIVGGIAAALVGEIGAWDLGRAAICAVGGFILMEVIAIVVGGIYFGDVKMTGALGMMLGFEGFLAAVSGAMLVPMVLAGILGVFVMLLRPNVKGLPMGPFMAISSLFYLAFPGVAVETLRYGF